MFQIKACYKYASLLQVHTTINWICSRQTGTTCNKGWKSWRPTLSNTPIIQALLSSIRHSVKADADARLFFKPKVTLMDLLFTRVWDTSACNNISQSNNLSVFLYRDKVYSHERDDEHVGPILVHTTNFEFGPSQIALPPRRLAGPEHQQGLLHACIAIFCVPCPWCCSFSSFPCRLRIKRPLKVNMTFWPSYFTNFEQVSGQRTSIT